MELIWNDAVFCFVFLGVFIEEYQGVLQKNARSADRKEKGRERFIPLSVFDEELIRAGGASISGPTIPLFSF